MTDPRCSLTIQESETPVGEIGVFNIQSPSLIFLGGIFLPEQTAEIHQQSRGVVQNAADSLQKAFLRGFSEVFDCEIQAVNLPFIGSYPKGFAKLWFTSRSGHLGHRIRVDGRDFLNLRFVKFVARFISAIRGLGRAIPIQQRGVIVVYSAHLPFLAAARVIRAFRPGTSLCLILPDLPEFMGEGGLAYRLIKSVEAHIFRRVIRKFDSFVLLTDEMGNRLGIPKQRRIVVEGIYDPANDAVQTSQASIESNEFVVLYTGTLAARYGIGDLLEAFACLDLPQARLWICGVGDALPRVTELVASDDRVRYFGQVTRTEALALQRQATVLVNPRRPEGEFTKYSFPSKTMEYLASGRPVIMHKLPGIPHEYLEHLIVPPSPDSIGLAAALTQIANRPAEWREDRGRAGRQFVLTRKSPAAQVARILSHWRDCGLIDGLAGARAT